VATAQTMSESTAAMRCRRNDAQTEVRKFTASRLLIVRHAGGHGPFLRGRRANGWLGRVLGVVTLTAPTFREQLARRSALYRIARSPG
jgi:hypothetical protein